jgi:uncharacterized membrane protein
MSAITTIIFVVVGTYFAFKWSRKTAFTAVAGFVLYASSWIIGYTWGAGSVTLVEVMRDSASWTPTQYWSTVAAQLVCVAGILVWFIGCEKAFINWWWGSPVEPAT